jgi:hypothetical protein
MVAIAPIIAGVAGPLFGLVDKLFTSDEERAAAKLRIVEMEQNGELEATRLQLSAILSEAQSSDPWTSRARPTFLYLMYLIIMLSVGGSIAGIWWPDSVTTAGQNMSNLLNAIPDSLYWLFGAGYLGYSGARSFDKWKGAGPH